LILSRRVDFPIKPNRLSKYKYNHPLIRKIICVSDEIKRISSQDIKDKEKLITIHSGVDLGKFKKIKNRNFLRTQFSLNENNILIGNTSALADHKDYFTFIDTAEIISKKHKEAIFFIMGDGPLRERIKEYIESKNLKNIILTGFVNEIIEALSSLDIFLFTSKTEGLGTSVLDALGCGVPVVATKAGGVPEMIEHNKNGLLANTQAPKELAQSIELLINDESLRSRFNKEGKKTILNFSKEKTAAETIKIYEELTTGK
jgi:glycosyltransferase involved in cell wall biosynthesis